MNWFDKLDQTPVTYLVLLAYITLAFLTDPIQPPVLELINYGASSPLLVQDGQLWRLLAAAFLHGGLLHLAFNAYCMAMLGPALESSIGSLRFALLYVVAAVGGNIVATIWSWSPAGLVVGGSGAIFGICGAMIAISMRRGRHLFEFLDFAGPRSLLWMLGINLLIGFLVEEIGNAAHIGGLIAGFALAFVFLHRGRNERIDGPSRLIQLGWVALFVSLLCYCRYPVGNRLFVLVRQDVQSLNEASWQTLADQLSAPEREAYSRLRER